MNKVAKGNRIELLVRKKLESVGYLVEKKNRNRYQSPDFWGMFDLIAIMGTVVRLIQVKSNASDFYKARKEIRTWKKVNHVQIPCEVWLWIDRNEFRVEEIV